MKREELDKLKAKYLEGKTSLEEERILKESAEEEFFTLLKEPTEKMEWDFDDFMKIANEPEVAPVDTKIYPMKGRIIALTSIAASLVLGFFLIRQIMGNNSQVEPVIAHVNEINEPLDVEMPKVAIETSKEPLKPISEKNEGDKSESTFKLGNQPQIASVKKSLKKKEESVQIANALDEELYVEINGVKIYDQEKALEVTETALHLATSNLKKGMEGLEHIKYLKIEI